MDHVVLTSKIDKIIIGDVENISIPYDNEYFDCIIYADVLEHLINPLELLTRHKSKLADNGYIIASIPNIAHYKIIKMLSANLFLCPHRVRKQFRCPRDEILCAEVLE